MIVKFMSDENAADDDSRKTFRLLSGVKTVEFARSVESGAVACLTMDDGSYHEEYLRGNAYAMNDAGKTVASFGACELPPDHAVAPDLKAV